MAMLHMYTSIYDGGGMYLKNKFNLDTWRGEK